MLVDAERGAADLEGLVTDQDDVAIAAVTAAELLVGIELADGRRREGRKRFVEAVLAAVTIEEYDLDVARAHAAILADVRRAGRPRGAHDLIVGATALARKREVVTSDRDGFDDIVGLVVRGVGARRRGEIQRRPT